MSRQKVNVAGGSIYIGYNIKRKHMPSYCVKNGKRCVYRIKMTGIFNTKSKESACGYMYYTGKSRGEVLGKRGNDMHIEYPDVCDKYSEEMTDPCVWAKVWEGEEEDFYGDECDSCGYR